MQLQGLLGIAIFVGVGYLFSTRRRAVDWRLVTAGLLLQFSLAILMLRAPYVADFFDLIARAVTVIISFADRGTEFLFGKASDPSGPWGFIFAVRVLPVIIFFASFMAVLYHLGVMQRLVAAVAWLLRKTLRVTGVEALSAAANIFVGQTEAPLTVRPYIAGMTRSQIMAIMTGGFATIAGSVLAAFVDILGNTPEAKVAFAKHLLTASVMSAPAGLLMAKLMMPETERPTSEDVRSLTQVKPTTQNVMDAAAEGATDGLKLALNVAAMLVAFVALVAMLNWPLTALSEWAPVAQWRTTHGLPVFSFQNILGMILRPVAWCMGVEWRDAGTFASLLGQQVITTEFLAYLELGNHVRNGAMSDRSCAIAAYALCGFANLPSIAIQIGGLSAMAPARRADFVSIGLRAMCAGAMACWMTGSIAGLVMR